MDCLFNTDQEMTRNIAMDKQATECANELLTVRKQLAEGQSIKDGKLEDILLLLHEAADLLLMSI